MKKIIVIGVIALFICVSVIPSINANISRLPVKSKLVETAVRIHRDNRVTPYTVKLTEKESDEIDRIFDNIKVSLDSAVTDEEIDEIYDDTVESLYKLGMFPKMTVEEAKQLVNGKNKNPNVKSSSGNLGTGDENFNCEVTGEAGLCFMFSPGRLFFGRILLTFILGFMRSSAYYWNEFNFPLWTGRIAHISFGSYYKNIYGEQGYSPSSGWVWTNGSNGEIKWEGKFYGNIEMDEVFYSDIFYGYWEYCYQGISKFEGLWTWNLLGGAYFLGNAEHVSLSYTPSWP